MLDAGLEDDNDIIARIFSSDFSFGGSGDSYNSLIEQAERFIDEGLEGKRSLRLYMKIERSPKLIQRFKNSLQSLDCQVCGFNFRNLYGSLGQNFIEAHHTVPLASLTGPRQTFVEELAAVCSNCHQMLHQRMPPLTIEDLRKILREQNA